MAEAEGLNTMFQNAFTKVSDGVYALRTSAQAGGGTQTVQPAANTAAFSGPNAESGFGQGLVTAPAADTVIATHTPPAGANGKLHRIEVTVWLAAGTPAAADDNNMAFKFGAGVISRLPVPRAINVPTKVEFYFNAATGTAFAVNSVGAATAGVVYGAFLTATKVVS